MQTFDFEKPILALEEKIKKLGETSGRELTKEQEKELLRMNEELEVLKKNIYSSLSAWQKIQISRHPDRPKTHDYIRHLFTDFIELHGDRNSHDDKSMTGGFASLDKQTVMVIGQEKGHTIKEKQKYNFGMNSPSGYKKAVRLMKLAEKFGKPVICFIDTPGASPDMESERQGQAEAIAQSISRMLKLKVPVISVVIGEGTSAGALAIGVADRVLMMEYTWYSVISPEACSSLLWHDWDHREQAAEALKLTSDDLCKFRLIDDVIAEPTGGAHRNPEECYIKVKDYILKYLAQIDELKPEKRIQLRFEKYIKIGNFTEITA